MLQEFSKKGIIEFLHQKAICDCMDIHNLSNCLGTISPRMIRKHIASGSLKPIDNESTMYIFRCEDIADWLLRFPRYLFKREESKYNLSEDKYNELNNITRRMVKSHWANSLLKVMDIDDICSAVICNILRKRYNGHVNDNTLVYRELIKLWDKESKRVDTICYDPQSFNGTTNEGENDND